MRSISPAAQRYSTRRLRPSQPNSARPRRKAAIRACPSGSSSATPISTPIRRVGCCARAASGQAAAAPPSRTMDSRLVLANMRASSIPDGRGHTTAPAVSLPHSLPGGGWQVLGASLNCSESGRALSYRRNGSPWNAGDADLDRNARLLRSEGRSIDILPDEAAPRIEGIGIEDSFVVLACDRAGAGTFCIDETNDGAAWAQVAARPHWA